MRRATAPARTGEPVSRPGPHGSVQTPRPRTLLLDSAATLRLIGEVVADELDELSPGELPPCAELRMGAAGRGRKMPRMADPPPAPPRAARAELIALVQWLRESRTILAAVAPPGAGCARPPEASAWAALAASVDRVLARLDELGAGEDAAGPGLAHALRAAIGEQLLGVLGHLRPEHAAAQQLDDASGVLQEMERRFTRLAALLDLAAAPGSLPPAGR